MNETTNNQERRRMKRQHISYYLPVLDPATLTVIGHLVDISQIGLLLDTTKPLVEDQEYHLHIDTPTGISNKDCVIFSARVKWCHMDRIQPNIYNNGFEITSISHGDSATIQLIADMYGSG